MGFGTGRALDSPMNGLRRETAWSPIGMEASRTLESIHEPPLPNVVRDANGQALVHIFARSNESEAMQAKMLTMDEARRIAVNEAA